MKTILDVTGIKDHPDIKSVYNFLEGHGFATSYCDEIRKFLPDNADTGEHAIDNFFVRAKPVFVEVNGEKVKCWAAIVPADEENANYMLIVLADCKVDEYAKLERVIAYYQWEIRNNADDDGAECIYSGDTKAILAAFNEDKAKCPFCEKKQEMEFGSQSCHAQLGDDGLVNIYTEGRWQGSFKFPKCPCCGKDILQPVKEEKP